MLRISYNANGLRHLPLEQAVSVVAAAGYEGIELSLHPNHLDPFTLSDQQLAGVRRTLDEQGLTACCLATGADTLLSDERFEPSLIHPDADGRGRRVDLLRRAIELAVALDVPVVSFASGIRRPEVSPQAAEAYLQAGLERCLEEVGDGVTLALEPEPGFFVETNDEAAAWVRRLGSPRLRVNQDVGHVNVCEEDFLDSVARTLPLTVHIHVEDIKDRVHYHEIPGDGDIDFPALIDVITAGGYDGFLSVELYNHGPVYREALRRSLAFLRPLVFRQAVA